MVTYEFRHLTLPGYLPVMHQRGDAGTSGHGEKPDAIARKGGSHFDPRITIVSDPPKPDNFRVEIKTEDPPPNTKPPIEAKIPDVISEGAAPEAPKPPSPQEAADDPKADRPAAAVPPKPLINNGLNPPPGRPTEPPPALPAPVALAANFPDIAVPHLEIPPPPPAKSIAPASAKPAPAPSEPSAQEASQHSEGAPLAQPANVNHAATATTESPRSAESPKLLALSVDPAPLKDTIPVGIREGAFSISPAGTVQGAAAEAPGALTNTGTEGQGPGVGETSTGIGKGNSGGGRETPGITTSPMVSVSGRAGATGISAGTLPPLKAEELVYAVKPETPKARAPNVVVSSGSSGGGGLRMFGVLHGDKIYTVYFSMPGKSWILQYCARLNSPRAEPPARAVQIRIQPPLVPPAAIEQFDFQRPAPLPDRADTMIVLHGTIHEDGSVGDLSVVQGSDATNDAAAQAAFGRWKFKPAQLAGEPVVLDILLGIPL